jgi:hypothetical protein
VNRDPKQKFPVNMTFVSMSLVALVWVVVIPTCAGAQVTMTQDASDIAGKVKYLARNAQLDGENATSPLYVASPGSVLQLAIGSPVLAPAFNPDQVFSSWAKVVSLESTVTHFGSHLDMATR